LFSEAEFAIPPSIPLIPHALVGAFNVGIMLSPESGPFELVVPELVRGIDMANWINAVLRINNFIVIELD
jgi:hypothetical protein